MHKLIVHLPTGSGLILCEHFEIIIHKYIICHLNQNNEKKQT